MSKLCNEFDQDDYRNLPAQTAQQVIKQVFKCWKSYFKALKEFKQRPSKFFAKPKPPKYKKKDGFGLATFTNQQIKLKDGFIYFPKKTNIEPIKTKVNNICQVRITPQATCFVVEIVYEQSKFIHNDIEEKNVLALDLGINNFVATINNVEQQPFIINGGKIKAINAYYNRKKAKLMSFIGNKGTSNRIEKLTFKRNNLIENALHQTSAYIIKYCIQNNVGTLVVGKNDHWKSKAKMGKVNNQNFISIPHARFINKLSYKCELHNIKFVVQEESYTSKCDHLALEPIQKHETYLGKRVRRGLFKSSIGKNINSDINGAIGILLKSKVVQDGEKFIRSLLNTGLVSNPIKLNII